MNQQAIEKTELNKILSWASEYAVLEGGKARVKSLTPTSSLAEAKRRLKETEECVRLLFSCGISRIEYFPPFEDELQRAQKGSSLTFSELLKTENLLRSTRIAHSSIIAFAGEDATCMETLANQLYFDEGLEEEIRTKIVSDTEMSDTASEKLYLLRREIRSLNEKIRARLSEYLTGGEAKYLQENIVTMRDNRYVLPVRAEYKRNVRGFIHDRSASGATFFIEPEEVLEMNNELRSLTLEEKEEVARILSMLSKRVGTLANELIKDIEILEEIDCAYARAEFGYKLACSKPEVNAEGDIDILEGRHPLIDRKKVVPVSLRLGEDYRFLLISGPNTGGKTVTLKMVGLFCMMAACGFFVPAKQAKLSIFDEIYCDIGDSQSIEESLSTFSSHITNIIEIVNRVKANDLVLIDELGGGTDPEEGQALAKAIVSYLLKTNCVGVLTTHYTSLKEFAFSAAKIENACMEFDSNTLQPLYVIRIGLPGASNALAISRRLGLKESILADALHNLSDDAQRFENILRTAEESRVLAEKTLHESNALKAEWQEKIRRLDEEKARLQKEKEKWQAGAKAEARKTIHQRVFQAEELLFEIEEIFKKERYTEADLIAARTLKNRLSNQAYESDVEENEKPQYRPVEERDLRVGAHVLVKSTGQEGVVQSVRVQKKEAEILCGTLKVRSKFSDLAVLIADEKAQNKQIKARFGTQKQGNTVQVKKSLEKKPAPTLELNIIGYTVLDALPEVEAFLDAAVLANLEEVRIVHGVGTGKLRAGVHDFLRQEKSVAEFRLGKYGEGETGVTIVKLR